MRPMAPRHKHPNEQAASSTPPQTGVQIRPMGCSKAISFDDLIGAH